MIIECPNCNTKFAIDDNLIEEKKLKSSDPVQKFHCARCKKYFEQKLSTENQNEDLNLSSNSEIKQLTLLTEEEFSSSIDDSIEEQTTEEKEDLKLDELFDEIESVELEDDFIENAKASWPRLSTQHAGKWTTSTNQSPKYEEFNLSNARNKIISELNFSKDKNLDYLNDIRLFDGTKYQRHPIITLGFLPTLIAVMLCYYSTKIEESPSFLRFLLNSKVTQVSQIPPQGLQITNLQSEILKLENGQKIIEIKGEIYNDTLEEFKNVIIEAKTFDDNNVEQNSILAFLDHKLSEETKINNLNLETILDLQNDRNTSKSIIKPGEKESVRMFIPVSIKQSLSQMKWFGARVFSLQENS